MWHIWANNPGPTTTNRATLLKWIQIWLKQKFTYIFIKLRNNTILSKTMAIYHQKIILTYPKFIKCVVKPFWLPKNCENVLILQGNSPVFSLPFAYTRSDDVVPTHSKERVQFDQLCRWYLRLFLLCVFLNVYQLCRWRTWCSCSPFNCILNSLYISNRE